MRKNSDSKSKFTYLWMQWICLRQNRAEPEILMAEKQSFFCQSKRRRDTVSYIEFVRDFHTADRIVRGPDLQQPVKRNGYHLSEILLQSCQPGIEIFTDSRHLPAKQRQLLRNPQPYCLDGIMYFQRGAFTGINHCRNPLFLQWLQNRNVIPEFFISITGSNNTLGFTQPILFYTFQKRIDA